MADANPDYEVVRINHAPKPNTPEAKIFQQAVALTNQYYTIGSEKQAESDFRKNMGNNDANHQEGWIALVNKKTGKVEAATNYAAYAGKVPANDVGAKGYAVDIYSPVAKGADQQNLLGVLQTERNKASQDFVGHATHTTNPSIYAFVEQNNPLLMTPKDYVQEHNAHGDEVAARNGDESRGMRRLEMPYIQPSLGAGQDPSRSLDLMAGFVGADHSTHPPQSVPSAVVGNFLGDYYAHSFPKGTHLQGNHALTPMVTALNANTHIPTAPAGRYNALTPALADIPHQLANHQIPANVPIAEIVNSNVALGFLHGKSQQFEGILPRVALAGKLETAREQAAAVVHGTTQAVTPDNGSNIPVIGGGARANGVQQTH